MELTDESELYRYCPPKVLSTVWFFVQKFRNSGYSPLVTALRVLSSYTPLKFRFLFANIDEEVIELTHVSQLCRYCPPRVGVEAVGSGPREIPHFLIILIFMIMIIDDGPKKSKNR